jgi:LPXTG-motif cell wall-anchored protein
MIHLKTSQRLAREEVSLWRKCGKSLANGWRNRPELGWRRLPPLYRNVQEWAEHFPVVVVLPKTGSQVMGIAVSGITGVVLLAIGSKFVMPIGVESASLVALLGVASIMLSFGLADGE